MKSKETKLRQDIDYWQQELERNRGKLFQAKCEHFLWLAYNRFERFMIHKLK